MKLEENDTAVVTGASSGIGSAIAEQLSHKRINLVLGGQDLGALNSVAADTMIRAASVKTIVGDLTNQTVIDQYSSSLEKCSVLVCSAGRGMHGLAADLGIEQQCQLIRVNCESLTRMTLEAIPHMVERGRGVIVHIASLSGLLPFPKSAVYGATKAYVVSFSRALDMELKGTGVRVVAVCPGPVPSRFQARSGAMPARDRPNWSWKEPEEIAQSVVRAIGSPKPVIVPNSMDRLFVRYPKLFSKIRQVVRKIHSQ